MMICALTPRCQTLIRPDVQHTYAARINTARQPWQRRIDQAPARPGSALQPGKQPGSIDLTKPLCRKGLRAPLSPRPPA